MARFLCVAFLAGCGGGGVESEAPLATAHEGGGKVHRPVQEPLAARANPLGDGGLCFELTQPFAGEANPSAPENRGGGHGAFDVIATDMDLDGDPDVLINWHLSDLELYENKGSSFRIMNDPEADRSGLDDQFGVHSLSADWDGPPEDSEKEWPQGIYVWQDTRMAWAMWLVAPASGPPRELSVTCNETLRVTGLEGEDELDGRKKTLRITLVPGQAPRRIGLINQFPTAALRISQEGSPSGTLAYWVGADLTKVEAPNLELRKSDPHGMAWVQAISGPRPDLVVIRGGNRGTLAPPDLPKSNRVFVGQDSGLAFAQVDPALAPRDFARGRGLEWVDVNNDGSLELSLANRSSPNGLWFQRQGGDEQSGFFENRAKVLGLATLDAQFSAWMDVDSDGWQDQLQLRGKRLVLMRNQGGEKFEELDAEALGLVIPSAFRLKQEGFETTCLSILDVDGDGALDVWLSSLGQARTHVVFRAVGDGFENVTKSLGLANLKGTGATVRCDLDNDGFVDVLALGTDPMVLHNQAGKRFERIPLATWFPNLPQGEGISDPIRAATAADVDGDGRMDWVLVSRTRFVAMNRTENGNHCLRVHLTQEVQGNRLEPMGTLVRVLCSGGGIRVARYGSARRSHVSQTLGALRFGIPQGSLPERIEVRWPGTVEWESYDPPQGWDLHLQR